MLAGITWGTYIFFAMWTVMGGAFIYFFVPETKGKTLEEMDMVFGSHTSAEEMEQMAIVQERIGLTALWERRSSTAGPVNTKEKIAQNKEEDSVVVERAMV
jgi:hypothetical protein